MIELRVENYCQNCPFFKPIVLPPYDGYFDGNTVVVCKRWETCSTAVSNFKLEKETTSNV